MTICPKVCFWIPGLRCPTVSARLPFLTLVIKAQSLPDSVILPPTTCGSREVLLKTWVSAVLPLHELKNIYDVCWIWKTFEFFFQESFLLITLLEQLPVRLSLSILKIASVIFKSIQSCVVSPRSTLWCCSVSLQQCTLVGCSCTVRSWAAVLHSAQLTWASYK